MASSKIPAVPHSWHVDEWPAGVYPGKASKGKYTIRANRDALVAAGALVRVGRDLVVMGAPYSSWLAQQGSRVNGFELAMNRTKSDQAAA